MATLKNMKVTIVTPVHIGSGEVHRTFEYNLTKNVLKLYDMKDILSNMPNNKLLDENFLRRISTLKNGQSTKNQFYTEVSRYIDYSQFKPKYELECHLSKLNNNDISEQIKSLNRPYIPGSSLKGAIFNAITYDIVKENCNLIFVNKNINHLRKNFNLETIFSIIYPEIDKNQFSEFEKQVRNCLICRDTYFDKMIFLNTYNEQILKQKRIPTNNVECIQSGQSASNMIIKLDNRKLNKLKEIYTSKAYTKLMSYMSYKKIQIIMNNYFKDVISEEIDDENKIDFYSSMNLYEQIEKLKKDQLNNAFYVRLGKNTNYFFKSISYIVKKENPDFYKDHFDLFTPIPLKNKVHPNADTLPVTRTIFEDDENTYYPGVVKIEYIIKD